MNAALPAFGAHRKAPPATTLSQHAFDLLCLSMAAVLALHASHLPPWLCVLLGFVLAGRWWQRRRFGGRIPWWMKLLPTLLLPVIVVMTYGSLFGRAPGSALAVGLLVLKLLESERPRDARSGIAFACFVLMSALLFQQNLLFTALVALGLIPALATLRALQPQPHAASWQRDLLPAARTLLLALPLALAAFLFLPRLSSPLWGAPNADETRTGLSDSLTPGSLSELLIDDSPAMRVSFQGNPPAPERRYFRGYVMWHFDGRTWNAPVRLPLAPAPIKVQQSIDYNIQLEPTHNRLLPTLDVPLVVPTQAQLGHNRVLLARKPVTTPHSYDVRSALRYRLQPTLPARARQRALQLPVGFNSQTHQLAAQWQRQYHADGKAIMQVALRWFRERDFIYTLTPPALGRNSVDDFLFSTRAGYCEHYASSFTVLMRAAGVPARVVTGYLGGYWNRMGDYLLVRQSDAHAWSEVWLAGQGWVRVDPTATVNPARVQFGANANASAGSSWLDGSWLHGLRNRWDVANRWWDRAVLGFNALRQRGLLTPFNIPDAGTGALVIALTISLCLVLGVALFWSLYWPPARDPLRATQLRLEKKLARLGVQRRQDEGPRDYFARAVSALPSAACQLNTLGSRYVQMRYGKVALTPERLRRYRRLVRDFHLPRVVK